VETIEDMFLDMLEKLMEEGKTREMLQDLEKHLGDRKIRVGTMCSGTECPIIVLELFEDCEYLRQFLVVVLRPPADTL
jgi:hypothetical protein